ncbi:MAG TPA: MFS transporter [Gammaproteobacteria bacterium]|nr:MFS transporter [Gammaproteobacteria bacterium]
MKTIAEAPLPAARLDRNFYLLIGGSFVSMLGDQFTLVALPWLVLKLTGSAVALGTVLALMAVPRALFMLIGGAVVDRLTPLRVLLVARSTNALLIALLAGLVWSGGIQLWMLYGLALAIGTATAFVYPAGSAILPQVAAPEKLAAANGIVMALRQLSLFVGPGLAGLVIALFAGTATGAVPDASGIAVAFTVDAVSFVASIVSLLVIRVRETEPSTRPVRNVFGSIAEGCRYVWRDVPLRAFMLYVAAASLFVSGPIQVGLPVLADRRLDWGAAAYGTLISATGGGALLGTLIAGVAAGLVGRRLGLIVLLADGCNGLLVIAFGSIHATWLGALIMFVVGTLGGIIQVSIFTWIQRRVAPEMMGRAMSLLMFTFMGLGPISAAAGGVMLARIGVTGLFAAAGAMLVLIVAFSLTRPSLRGIRMEARPAATAA